jgi:hypothetical protein
MRQFADGVVAREVKPRQPGKFLNRFSRNPARQAA